MPLPKMRLPKEDDNGLHKMISPEDIEYDTPYAFTMNPIDEIQNFGKLSQARINFVSDKVSTDLVRYFHGSIEYEMYMEFSCKGRLHYHGTITFKKGISKDDRYANVRTFYLETFPKMSTQYSLCLEEIKDDGWDDYIKKSSHLFPTQVCHTSKEITKQKAEKIRKTSECADFLDSIGRDVE